VEEAEKQRREEGEKEAGRRKAETRRREQDQEQQKAKDVYDTAKAQQVLARRREEAQANKEKSRTAAGIRRARGNRGRSSR
jgi:hypothetical protein